MHHMCIHNTIGPYFLFDSSCEKKHTCCDTDRLCGFIIGKNVTSRDIITISSVFLVFAMSLAEFPLLLANPNMLSSISYLGYGFGR